MLTFDEAEKGAHKENLGQGGGGTDGHSVWLWWSTTSLGQGESDV